MRKFLQKNIAWTLEYFQETKWLFDMLALFFVLETFLYSVNLEDSIEFTQKEISALKIIFWALVFIVSLLLYVKTEEQYTQNEDDISTPLFSEAVFSKYIIRLIIYLILSINSVLFFRVIKLALHNSYFTILWVGLIVMIFFELTRFLVWKLRISRNK